MYRLSFSYSRASPRAIERGKGRRKKKGNKKKRRGRHHHDLFFYMKRGRAA